MARKISPYKKFQSSSVLTLAQSGLTESYLEDRIDVINSHADLMATLSKKTLTLNEIDYMSYGLSVTVENLKNEIICKCEDKIKNNSLVVLFNKVDHSLTSLKNSLSRIEENIEIHYKKLSTFDKLNYEEPDLDEIHNYIVNLEELKEDISKKHGNDLKKIILYYKSKQKIAIKRLNDSYISLINAHKINKNIIGSNKKQLQYFMWSSVFSFSSSTAIDLYNDNAIYDVLRSVNRNYSEMGNMEIWWETLWMSSESLVGLSSLVKGAYFESLVAKDTGGILFEHFNHPDTDIVIDGEEIQLKATDSISYIDSVDEDITIMATTEIAEKTDAIDSGISNLELDHAVHMAIGGGLIDTGDALVDGILAGLGTLGTFATLKGINHAAEKYNNGGNGEDAISEGLEVAIMGTVKGLCDTYDLGYKVATSKQGKAVGKTLLKTGKISFRVLSGTAIFLDKALTKM